MVALYLCALIVAVAGLKSLGFTLNTTSSMPLGFYRVTPADGVIARGSIVQLCVDRAVAAFGAQRGYLPAGSCASGRAPLLKYAVGVPGDVVVVSDSALSVNGRPLSPGSRAARDSRGRPLPHVPAGRYVLGPDALWLWTPYAKSWDSRYFGPVRMNEFRGIAHPVIRLPDWLAGKS
jgi:conjugative transfer signal peptidase TraF